MHSETEGKLTLGLTPTSKDPYPGLVYREDAQRNLNYTGMKENDIRGRQLAQDAGPDLYDHL
ncbi:hypothetical protein FD754_006184 [Muntiacus muntjak]|uniref:Uncharacterized protein n=1 Tax=Muntiacus muntjak TaxID=9888 RepID=A0A5N3WMI0_MUNMU|nr:hypothetical protein FD754_006184 [Muntiacus muntjak]